MRFAKFLIRQVLKTQVAHRVNHANRAYTDRNTLGIAKPGEDARCAARDVERAHTDTDTCLLLNFVSVRGYYMRTNCVQSNATFCNRNVMQCSKVRTRCNVM